MRLGLRELRRKPLRFAVMAVAMWLLAVMMLLLGGLLDGLSLGSTGVLRAQDGQLVTFSTGARTSLVRSRVPSDLHDLIGSVPGVLDVAGFGVVLVGAKVPGRGELANTVVVGYESRTGHIPAPPGPSEAYADRSLQGAGVRVGDVLGMGPERLPLTVVGWVDDANYLGQGGLWVEPGTWREILGSSRPDSVLAQGTFQALSVVVASDVDAHALARTIDDATAGGTQTVTKSDAIMSLPGIKEQHATMSQVIVVTAVVAGVVVALFFALVTLERVRLYAVLKALGASTGQIFAGLVVQAVVVTAAAFFVAVAVAYAAQASLPPGKLPFRLEVTRVVATAVILLVVSTLGSALSLRRVTRIDPGSAIG